MSFQLKEGFELDHGAFELRRDGVAVKVERIPLELLFLLVDRRGELVTRAEIIEKLWGSNVFVDTDNSINTAVRKVRQALHDDPDEPRFVQTVPGKGYRFIGELQAKETAVQEPAAIPAAQLKSANPKGRIKKIFLPALVFVVMAAMSVGLLERRAHLPPKRVMLVVLPFENLSGDPNQDYFADGLTEETITDLGGLNPEYLGVIARTSAMAYKRTTKTIDQIGRELRVDYVLESSFRREGDRLRVNSQLIRTSDQTHLWAHAYDRKLSDFIALQNELGASIAEQVKVELAPQVREHLANPSAVNAVAHDAYLRGRYFWLRRVHHDAAFSALHGISAEDFEKSRINFQQAVDADPTYALGWCGLSNYYGAAAVHGVISPIQGWPLAEDAARKALELDAGLAQAHHALSAVYFFYKWDMHSAEGEIKRAIELSPNDPEFHRFYARILQRSGRGQEALVQAHTAEQLDPLAFNGSRAAALLWGGDYEQAIKLLKETETSGVTSPETHELLAEANEALGRYAESVEETEQALVATGNSMRAGRIGKAFASGGYTAVLDFYLSDLQSRGVRGYVSPFTIAETYAWMGNRERALVFLEKARAERSSLLYDVAHDPAFSRMKTDPGFVRFLSELSPLFS